MGGLGDGPRGCEKNTFDTASGHLLQEQHGINNCVYNCITGLEGCILDFRENDSSPPDQDLRPFGRRLRPLGEFHGI